ncbi:MAG: F0F1 ATP synthase subunit delta [Gammaproteobacteria bacterium]|nr:F0F1 ATP synthase subunit delta [Gammaproteobacteria bacterium]MCF6259351.1 F0F1 ATP synthase subunit delta [Gammaproteobacteria bacterium]
MAEKSTIARPYAEAVFQLADANGQLKEWSAMLQTVALIATDAGMQGIIGNTSVNKAQLAQLVIDVAGDVLTDSGRNLIKLLAENRRLDVIAEITVQFEILKAETEKTVEAEMVCAQKVSAKQQSMIAAKLKARLGREVSLKCTVDESLMGGAIIKAGDMVIDGSVSGQLNKLSVELAG